MFQGKCSQENVISGICLEPSTDLKDSTSSLQELESGPLGPFSTHLKAWSMSGGSKVRPAGLPL